MCQKRLSLAWVSLTSKSRFKNFFGSVSPPNRFCRSLNIEPFAGPERSQLKNSREKMVRSRASSPDPVRKCSATYVAPGSKARISTQDKVASLSHRCNRSTIYGFCKPDLLSSLRSRAITPLKGYVALMSVWMMIDLSKAGHHFKLLNLSRIWDCFPLFVFNHIRIAEWSAYRHFISSNTFLFPTRISTLAITWYPEIPCHLTRRFRNFWLVGRETDVLSQSSILWERLDLNERWNDSHLRKNDRLRIGNATVETTKGTNLTERNPNSI